VRNANTSSVEYRVHYAGWNTRYDEWIKSDAISSVIDTPTDTTTPLPSKQKQSSAASVILFSSVQYFRFLFSIQPISISSNCVFCFILLNIFYYYVGNFETLCK